MLGKISKVTVGVTVGLVAAAPMAWAGGTGYDDTDVKGDKAHDSGKHWDDDKHHGHHKGAKACSFEGGDAGAASEISGGALANIVAQAPIAGNNIANLANCSDFLNHNLNDNLSGNNIAIL
jgi:hypothetical protein